MKTRIVSLVVLWVLSLYPSVGFAQTAHRSLLTVKVPFEFVVGNRTFPAGTYRFQSLLNSVPGKDTIEVLVVRGTEAQLYQAIVTDVTGSEKPNRPSVVFTHSGNRAFLSEVWEPGKHAGCHLHSPQDQTQAAENDNDKVALVASADR